MQSKGPASLSSFVMMDERVVCNYDVILLFYRVRRNGSGLKWVLVVSEERPHLPAAALWNRCGSNHALVRPSSSISFRRVAGLHHHLFLHLCWNSLEATLAPHSTVPITIPPHPTTKFRPSSAEISLRYYFLLLILRNPFIYISALWSTVTLPCLVPNISFKLENRRIFLSFTSTYTFMEEKWCQVVSLNRNLGANFTLFLRVALHFSCYPFFRTSNQV